MGRSESESKSEREREIEAVRNDKRSRYQPAIIDQIAIKLPINIGRGVDVAEKRGTAETISQTD
ncbi:hypothetical protein PABG_12392 [Paracoccidioides brasiliensis Pb03]|uniref:Uncharacterized protein n=2 Tax=Paracoccidioides brasiliensis TaxID=121759 RepID=A0A0A0HTQ2_PARBD|nr:uncharacterized protein PADG_11410 [Paracoccidioides brasiliensis Pb18]KGM92579.1 hypothetical protein PADG_11410 [Paracoccidioides brasiliensis Pb18]KGY14708.1 hypothetical protein PABG_12392 [Paracoccidioides brasiliensis Pb03]ODH19724.1 hypothetical protein ACO22_06113 [Paracoccidioides brasiliensis]